MRRRYKALVALHIFVGIGAIAGGLAGILDPQAPLGMPAAQLKNSPFDNYLIPGIILFTFIGLGNLVSALAYRLKYRYQGYLSGVFSLALVIFIVVQCFMLNTIHFLHIIFFVIGLVEAGLSMMILFEQGLFPANIFKRG